MSSSIDERIVQMTFDNQSFEDNVHTTLGTIDNLNDSLDSLGTASHISSTLDDISERFSNLGIIGITALENITNKAVDAGLKLAKSLTIDQVTAGFDKYTSSTKDIKALLNSTGKDIGTVTNQIQDLNWYSDATSYSYTAMVSALKSFAAQDIEVDEAIPMIMGIGNSLSYAGLAAENASGAFNLYSKAMGQGYMSMIQWKSLNLMGAATVDLKEKYIDAALALGTLKKDSDGTIKTLNGLEVSVSNFDSTLSNAKGKWLTTDVMKAVLGVDYGTYSTNLKKFGDGFNELADAEMSVTQQMDVYDFLLKDLNENYKAIEETTSDDIVITNWEQSEKGLEKYNETLKEFKNVYEEATNTIITDEEAESIYLNLSKVAQGLNDATSAADPYSKKTFLAAQEARTFSEAINAVKDAASSAWAAIFQNVFGNADEATKLWTDFSEWLYNTFMGPTLLIKDISDTWNKLGGRSLLFAEADEDEEGTLPGAFRLLGEAMQSAVTPLKKAFAAIYGEINGQILGEKLIKISGDFSFFCKRLKLSEETAAKVQKVFEGVFAVFDSVGIVVRRIVDALKPLAGSLLKSVGTFALDAASSLADFTISVRDYLEEHTFFEKAVSTISGIFESFKSGLTTVSDVIEGLVGKLINWGKKILDVVSSCFGPDGLSVKDIAGIGIGLSYLVNMFKKLKDGANISGIFKQFKDVLDGVSDAVDAFASAKRMEALRQLAISLLILAGAMILMASIDGDRIGQALGGIAAAAAILVGSLTAIDKLMNSKGGDNAKGGIFASLSNSLNKLTKTVQIAGIIAIAAAILIIAAAAKIFAGIKSDDIFRAVLSVAAVLAMLAGFLAIVSKIDTKPINGILGLGLAILAISLAAKVFAGIDPEGLGRAALAITIFILVAGVFFAAMEKLNAAKVIGISVALLIFSAAIIVLAAGLAIFSMLNFDNMANGLIIIASALAIFGVAALLLQGAILPMLGLAAAFVVFSASILVLALALAAMTLVDTAKLNSVVDGIIAPLFALAGMSLIVGALAPLMLLMAIGIAAMSASLIVLAIALGALLLLDLEALPDMIDKIFNALMTLGGASVILGIMSPIMLAASIAIAALAGSLALLAVALAGIGGFNSVTLGALVISMTALALELAVINAEMIILVAEFIALAAEVLALTALIVAIDVALLGLSGTAALAAAAIELASLATEKIALGMERFEQALDNIPDKTEKSYKAIKEFAKNCKKEINELVDEFKAVGKNAGQGLVDGLNDKKKVAKDAAYNLGRDVAKSLRSSLEVKSPSRVFAEIGKFADQGLAKGIENYSRYAENAATNLGDSATIALSKSFERIQDSVDEDYNITSVITPVLDLSEIQNGKDSLDGILNTNGLSASLTGYTEYTSADANFLADQITQLRAEMQNLKFENTGIGNEIRSALAGVGIYMNGNKVGNMVSQYQGNVRRATGN